MDVQDGIWKYELEICDNNYGGRAYDSVLTILNPKSTVLLSVPHCVKHRRGDNIKVADICTYGIARLVQNRTGCNLIANLGSPMSDPNWDSDCYYKKMVDNIINSGVINLMIDLHGMSCDGDNRADIDIGTNDGKTLCGFNFYKEVLSSINSELSVSMNKVFASRNPNTMASYVSSTFCIPSLQIEVSATCRKTDRAEDTIKFLCDLIESERRRH